MLAQSLGLSFLSLMVLFFWINKKMLLTIHRLFAIVLKNSDVEGCADELLVSKTHCVNNEFLFYGLMFSKPLFS